MNVPFNSFEYTNAEIRDEIFRSFDDVYNSNSYVLGSSVDLFEENYADFGKTKFSIGVSNGLDALHLCLLALGIGEGDEVIVPSNTYIATALAVTFVNAVPVFVEPNIHTYNIDVEMIAKSITSRTKAIIPVHLYGQAAEMDRILELAQLHNIYVIEDNAQAQGASFKGKLTGSFGILNATSFYPGKNLGAFGDAGGVTTDDEDLAVKVRALRNYGSNKKYYNAFIGHNMRMDELQAAFLDVKLKRLQFWNDHRVKAANFYLKNLSEVGDLILPLRANYATHVYHLFVVRTIYRDRLQLFLLERGVQTLIHYPVPPHLQEAYSFLGYSKGSFPIAEELADTCLSLPIWPGITMEQLDYVCNMIKIFYSEI